MDVFFYETFSEEEEALTRLLGTSVTSGFSRFTIQESGHSAPPARLISIRTQSVVPVDWVWNIGGILSRTTGFDHLQKLLTSYPEPIPSGYLEEYATRAVAEHAMMTVMALLRRLPIQTRQIASFDRNGLTGLECQGSKLLVVGVGRIGYDIAGIARGLGMVVKGVDIVQKHEDIEYVDRNEGIAWADVIVCAMNLTAQNQGYFSAPLLRKARPGVVFVNVARGEHSPLADMRMLLAEEHLGGLGLDVYEDEASVARSLRDPSLRDGGGALLLKELLSYSNVICTPHNAFNTRESVERKSAFTISQVNHFLKHGDFLWKI